MFHALLEAAMRERLGEAETRILNLWTEASRTALGRPLEVVTVDRRDIPEWASYPRVFNTAYPQTITERGLVLLVLMDLGETGNFDDIVWTHEVAHWVLFLDGFLGMQSFKPLSLDVEIALNSVTHHRAVYALQRSSGLNPQPIIDAGAAHDRDRLAVIEPGTHSDQLIALAAADDILSCDKSIATEIRGIVEERYPNAGRILRGVLDACATDDLQSADGVQRVTRRIVPLLGRSRDWVEWDNRAKLIEQFKRDSVGSSRADR